MMKDKIVLVPFPFDDLSSSKVRPAVCLTSEIQPYGHVVLAFITSQMQTNVSATDFVINNTDRTRISLQTVLKFPQPFDCTDC